MSAVELPDPAFQPDRACADVATEVFFPEGKRPTSEIARARACCLGCPQLVACAGWAAPLVASGALTTCVVASVYAPSPGARPQRKAAVAALEAIAAGASTEVEGAA
jgi:hypothetical protein